jgi:hypothetical protein
MASVFEGIAFFEQREFDSPDLPGSGARMDRKFLLMLSDGRARFGLPIKVNHGFRTAAYADNLRGRGFQAVKGSAHEIGKAADLACPNAQLARMMTSLFLAGFRRFGVMATALHVDNDEKRRQDIVWGYNNTPAARLETARKHLDVLMQNFNKIVGALETLEKSGVDIADAIEHVNGLLGLRK